LRVLVTGWFSFVHGEATAGDLMAKDVACEWLEAAGHDYDVAFSPAFGEGVRWWEVDPAAYSDVVFVCGPARGWQIADLLEHFSGCRTIGLDVSMFEGSSAFDVLLERDSDAVERRTSAENTKGMNDLVGAVERIPESLARSDGWHESMANSGS
jgi:hypothetical protein